LLDAEAVKKIGGMDGKLRIDDSARDLASAAVLMLTRRSRGIYYTKTLRKQDESLASRLL